MSVEKEVHYGVPLKTSIKDGLEKIYKPVSMTLGSHGRYVALETSRGNKFTKDGVSIAKEIVLENKIENIFVRAIVDSAMATLNSIGDGTTSTIILSYHMIMNMLDAMDSETTKYDVKKFLNGVDKAMSDVESIHKKLKDDSKPTLEDLISVATTSSNGDSEFGGFLGQIYHKIGSEGIINLNYHDSLEMKVEYAKGYMLEEGLLAYEFINRNGIASLVNPYVYVTNREITDADKFLTEIAEVINEKNADNSENRPLFIIATNYTAEVLATMAKNKDDFYCVPIKAPSIGDMRNGYLEDIAKITGGIFINGEKDMHLSELNIWDVLGECEWVEVKLGETVIATPKEHVESQIKYLNDLLEGTEDDENSKNFINTRISKINGSIADLYIKKSSVTEMSLNYDRYDDSIKATRNSIKNGVISGGGRVYMYMAKCLTENLENIDSNDSFVAGYESIIESLKSVLKVNLENSNHNETEIESITNDMLKSDDINVMYDTVKQGFFNSRETGVLESYASSIACLRNAFSVAKIIVNTGSAVIGVPQFNL